MDSTIDMNPTCAEHPLSYMDAVFLSPHKFLGGPGSSGVLVFNERLYSRDLPPSVAGGGTVDYVSPLDQDFIADIEEREKADAGGEAAGGLEAGVHGQSPDITGTLTRAGSRIR